MVQSVVTIILYLLTTSYASEAVLRQTEPKREVAQTHISTLYEHRSITLYLYGKELKRTTERWYQIDEPKMILKLNDHNVHGFDGTTGWHTLEENRSGTKKVDVKRYWAQHVAVWSLNKDFLLEKGVESETSTFELFHLSGYGIARDLQMDQEGLTRESSFLRYGKDGQTFFEKQVYEDYRDIGGVMLPHKITTMTNGTVFGVTNISYQVNPVKSELFFTKVGFTESI